MIAVHAKVLAVLTGQADVVIGLANAPGGPARSFPLFVEDGSWRRLVYLAQAVQGAGESVCETALEFGGRPAAELPPGEILRIGFHQDGDRTRMWLTYRTHAVDNAYGARIADYHLSAIRLIAADPDADHRARSLLSDAELDLQIHGMSGPVKDLPDRRVHELFEDRVREHPDAVAAVCDDRSLTYAQLNERANRIADLLLTVLSEDEQVVGVVTERDLDWMASVLAVFKAGAAYLPIDPSFPPGRIAAMLERCACSVVLTEQGSTANLAEALPSPPATRLLYLDDPALAARSSADPGIPVGPDRLAYLYFTSGSSGAPKGAMCEQAGMLNHIQAKINDLAIGPGTVVAQTAPQCFDISLWQLVAPLLVGGTTVIVPQRSVLDVGRFLELLVRERVEVAQVVPSYLEVLLAHARTRPVELPDLRCVSVTGEALHKELTVRWFERFPRIKLMNAYGLTETSDDTNHELLDGPPDGDHVPLGRLVQNVTAYVVDDRLAPVPLGAMGEILFSGVCVGRGYINDVERSAQIFITNPLRPGERLYRSGDIGRWTPDGKLEFHGRRDAQVKISGHRIELGEVESVLLRAPQVRDGAVIVRRGPAGRAQLVAFYTAPPSQPVAAIRASMTGALPGFMVPQQFFWTDALPLNDNGKIDRKALLRMVGDGEEATSDPPRTPSELRLAAVWADALGVPVHRIGRADDFFALGGTSLSALRVAARLDVSISDITRTPVLGELANALGRNGADGCLHLLADPGTERTGTLVCFPAAGGNTVNFLALAGVLAEHGLAVYGIEPPGEGPTRDGRPFAEVEQLATEAATAIAGLGPVMMWGHSSGAAHAVATALLLEQRGVKVQRVFAGAQTPGTPARRNTLITSVDAMSDEEIAAELIPGGAGLDHDHALLAATAYRHDVRSSSRYLALLHEHPASAQLSAPLTVVLAADDPHREEQLAEEWEPFAEHVTLLELPEGGHHFPRTRPSETAKVILGGRA